MIKLINIRSVDEIETKLTSKRNIACSIAIIMACLIDPVMMSLKSFNTPFEISAIVFRIFLYGILFMFAAFTYYFVLNSRIDERADYQYAKLMECDALTNTQIQFYEKSLAFNRKKQFASLQISLNDNDTEYIEGFKVKHMPNIQNPIVDLKRQIVYCHD